MPPLWIFAIGMFVGLWVGFLISLLVEANWIAEHWVRWEEEEEEPEDDDNAKVTFDDVTNKLMRVEWKDWSSHPN